MKDKNDDFWKSKLSKEEFDIFRNKGTEAPYSGKKLSKDFNGSFVCVACGNKLFEPDQRLYDDIGSLQGWPSFSKAIKGSVEYAPDNSLGMSRTEVTCSQCGGHLGHVFDTDGDSKHYCINATCLNEEKE